MATITLDDAQIANRVQWVRDLLSGDYKQGREALKTKDNGDFKYCCLGVACERIAPGGADLHVGPNTGRSSSYIGLSLAQRSLGISIEDQRAAGRWNDRDSYDFSRIADFVAWATEHKVTFYSIAEWNVPVGYATEWLQQWD